MTELKTLKDFDKDGDNGISIYQLKQEAIKWVKEFGGNVNVKYYFMTFFNITEEDLK